MKNKILILDTETTGNLKPIEPIEVAWLEIDFPRLTIVERYEERFNPSKEIELGALATSHIFKEEISSCRNSSESSIPKDTTHIIGHNIDYDWEVMGKPDVKRICTLALARKYLPDLDSHSQTALLYFFEGIEARERLKEAHSALCDVYNCYRLFYHLINLEGIMSELKNNLTIDKVWEISEKARIPSKLTFGKHKGELISDVKRNDPGWVSWLLKQSDVDPYLRIALTSKE